MFDVLSEYWEMKTCKQDQLNTAFICNAGTFQLIRMPFQLTSAPACLQTYVDTIQFADVPHISG